MNTNKRPNEIYTDRARLLEAIEEARIKDKAEHPEIKEPWFGSNYGFKAIERATGEPKGKWIEDSGIVACSHCRAIWLHRKTKYCPNCGARMEGEE